MADIKVTKDNFESEVLNSDKLVMVDFWAAWCGPCKMLSPIVSELADDYGDDVKVCKVNVDEEPALAQKFGIISIPTVMMFNKGEVVETAIGYRPKEEFVSVIEKLKG